VELYIYSSNTPLWCGAHLRKAQGKLYINFPSTSKSSDIFPFRFQIKMFYSSLTYTMRATCSANLILLHLFTVIIFSETYKL